MATVGLFRRDTTTLSRVEGHSLLRGRSQAAPKLSPGIAVGSGGTAGETPGLRKGARWMGAPRGGGRGSGGAGHVPGVRDAGGGEGGGTKKITNQFYALTNRNK